MSVAALHVILSSSSRTSDELIEPVFGHVIHLLMKHHFMYSTDLRPLFKCNL